MIFQKKNFIRAKDNIATNSSFQLHFISSNNKTGIILIQ